MNQLNKPADLPEWGYVDDLVFVFNCVECHYRFLYFKDNDLIPRDNDIIPKKCPKCGYSG
jgi:hypothetical protein